MKPVIFFILITSSLFGKWEYSSYYDKFENKTTINTMSEKINYDKDKYFSMGFYCKDESFYFNSTFAHKT